MKSKTKNKLRKIYETRIESLKYSVKLNKLPASDQERETTSYLCQEWKGEINRDL